MCSFLFFVCEQPDPTLQQMADQASSGRSFHNPSYGQRSPSGGNTRRYRSADSSRGSGDYRSGGRSGDYRSGERKLKYTLNNYRSDHQ
jgi:hypothetical protein